VCEDDYIQVTEKDCEGHDSDQFQDNIPQFFSNISEKSQKTMDSNQILPQTSQKYYNLSHVVSDTI
jgi:hypothetical protein